MSATLTAPAPTRSAAPLRPWIVLAVVLAAEVMDLLDATIMNVAAPTVRADLGGGTAMLQWLTAAYTLPFAVLLVTGGRLGDVFGRRRMFVLGAAGFTAASLASALAQSPEMLLATRVLQGAFGALLIPQGFGMIKQAFGDDVGKAFAAFGPVLGLSAVLGPIVGGVLIHLDPAGLGWRTIFLINVPVGLVTVVAGLRLLPDAPRTASRLDPIGVLLLSAAALALVYPLVQGRELDWPLWSFALMAAGVVGFGLFAAYEAHHRAGALVAPGMLRNRAYTSGILVAVGFFAAMTGLMLVVSLFCQLGLRFSPEHTGIALAPLPLGIALTAPLSFALVPRLGRKVIQVGFVLNAAGLVALALTVHGAGADTTAWTLAPGLLVCGLGMGFVLAPLFDLILSSVGEHEVGSASGVLNAVQQLAAAIGVAALGTTFFAFLDHGSVAPDAMEGTALATTALLALGFALSFRLPPKVRPGTQA